MPTKTLMPGEGDDLTRDAELEIALFRQEMAKDDALVRRIHARPALGSEALRSSLLGMENQSAPLELPHFRFPLGLEVSRN